MKDCFPETIIVDGHEYKKVVPGGEKLHIVIVDNRGLTFIGHCDLSGDNEQIVIRGARCVIVWGTSGHLAQLCSGPTKNTKLGHAKDVTVFRKQLVLAYVADEEAWVCK